MTVNASIYARFAAVALPPLVVAVGWLVYRDLDRVAREPLPSTVSTPAPIPPPTPVPTPFPAASAPAAAASSAFRNIYDQGIWGTNELGEGTSGSGSTLASTSIYRTFLQEFLKEHGIKSVVDAGCGDWEFSKAIDWRGIDYKGFDIVPSVIARDKKYEKPNIHFFVANVVTDELPPADLLVSKHVLQHLPNADVAKFLEQLPKYEHVLLVDSVDPKTLSGDNRDIRVGAFRYLDPTRPPFDLPGAKVLTWSDGAHMHQVVHLAKKK